MNKYSIGQTVYRILYSDSLPRIQLFVISVIRQVSEGFSYSRYLDISAPYVSEEELFETEELAVQYQISLLNALLS